jgi:hypothetical protein
VLESALPLLSIDWRVLLLVDRNGDGDHFHRDTFVHCAIRHSFRCFVAVFHFIDCSSRVRKDSSVGGAGSVHSRAGSGMGIHGYGLVRCLVRSSWILSWWEEGLMEKKEGEDERKRKNLSLKYHVKEPVSEFLELRSRKPFLAPHSQV